MGTLYNIERMYDVVWTLMERHVEPIIMKALRSTEYGVPRRAVRHPVRSSGSPRHAVGRPGSRLLGIGYPAPHYRIGAVKSDTVQSAMIYKHSMSPGRPDLNMPGVAEIV
ncbi:hypothetical protein PCH_Pc22g24080 [Penicillium rubens Wisconsin 54-1255]|uniref:Uncharacterized protein n=1 Tax=Penicillium rubens (strain ATCC 28089 / DSM 1075 / NRRL 1951 / Wisconsin 54-1255) TaxID=500485 RepID=B6HQ55_PENRW|nr:hypothetical protein PCH_Pc22g24080 [Penicillium rubens Wisconsin 54-1255]